MEGDDENINTLLCMGFPDVAEIKRALRLAKNDLNEAVAILTNEQPLSSYGTVDDLSLDVDMKYQVWNQHSWLVDIILILYVAAAWPDGRCRGRRKRGGKHGISNDQPLRIGQQGFQGNFLSLMLTTRMQYGTTARYDIEKHGSKHYSQ